MKKTIILSVLTITLIIVFTSSSHAAWWSQPTEIERIQQGTSAINIQFIANGSLVTYWLAEENESNLLILAITAFTCGNKVKFQIEGQYIEQIRVHAEGYQF